ncbi:DUF72 domain-containing protein [Brochothrix campestris]|uniref:DUF72 domain-containing protein n=1 Tax=Brochothrix campestris FSL F6-1037 TaxID=1265861 RepID=W7CR01_9LIST|nr:DUF72 domain-containing protein [Brochothrix campestris]EUJ35388.1 hypothetical protein BCAMP_11930 [Brochothrix campestris FSL F6-1037]
MVKIGLSGWSDHPLLYQGTKKQQLEDYASYFSVVELDSSFYAIPRQTTVAQWVKRTLPGFEFIVKANRVMTLHSVNGVEMVDNKEQQQLFAQFIDSFSPLIEAGKLAFVLLQFPPYFSCNPANIAYLKQIRAWLPVDAAVEFRHRSWYDERFQTDLWHFLTEQNYIHTMVDQPQVGERTVPFVKQTTAAKKFMRLHGRNQAGWIQAKQTDGDGWRDVRTLYCYNEVELAELAVQLGTPSAATYVIFNNNAGGDAAANGIALQSRFKSSEQLLETRQLGLFD